MATNDDIRVWAKENGYELEDDAISLEVRKAYLAASKPPVDEDKPVEKAPVIKEPSVADRAKKAVAGLRDKAGTTTAKRATRKVFSRVPVDKLIGRAWNILAQSVQPVNLPVARVLAVQSPVAGAILEDIIRDTAVDRILQPLARVEQRGELLFALVGPPLLVGAMTAKPEASVMLVPLLREALRSWIDIAGPHIEKIAEQERKFEEEYGQRIDAMIEMFFTQDPDFSEQPIPETSANGSKPVRKRAASTSK